MAHEEFIKDLVLKKHGARLGFVGFAKPTSGAHNELQELQAKATEALERVLGAPEGGIPARRMEAFREAYLTNDEPETREEFLIRIVREKYGDVDVMGGQKLKTNARMKLEEYLHEHGHANLEEKLAGFRREYLGR